MIESIALPKKHLVDLGLFGSVENSVIPHLADQRERILKNRNNPQVISRIAVQSSFYQQGIYQHLNPLVLTLIGDKNISMLGIKHAEKIFDFPKTKEEQARMTAVIRQTLIRLENEVILLRQVVTESLQEKPRIFNRLKYNVPVSKSKKLKGDFVEAYDASLNVVEDQSKIPEVIEWPVAVIPRWKNVFIAIGVIFYVPPIYFNRNNSKTHPGVAKKFKPKNFQAFSLRYHAVPPKDDIEKFGTGEIRMFVGSLFGGAKPKDVKVEKISLKPWIKVDMRNHRIKIVIPSSFIKDTTEEVWFNSLPHINYMVGVFVFLRIKMSDAADGFRYLSLSMDTGMEDVEKGKIFPRFSPSGGIKIWLTPSAAKTNLNKNIIFRQNASDNSLTDWIMTEEGTQKIFGIAPKQKPIGDWKSVEAHVTRLYLSTSGAGEASVDIKVPTEYQNMISNMSTMFVIEEPVLTIGWAALLKAKKLTELTYSKYGKPRVRVIKDLNVKIIPETVNTI